MDAKRDWGFAGDYVEGMYLMLQQDQPDDYVLATGETYPVREFVTLAAQAAGFELEWKGEGEQEKGIDKKSGKTIVQVNSEFYRPAEVELLIGTPEKAQSKLDWTRKVSYQQLVKMMVDADMARASRGNLRM